MTTDAHRKSSITDSTAPFGDLVSFCFRMIAAAVLAGACWGLILGVLGLLLALLGSLVAVA